jgi:glycerophosphoryl diester phosphodiesterase
MRPLRIGHRGAAGHAPENTLVSIEAAIRIGVDAVELDVQQTRDSQLVIIHDWRVDRTLDGEGFVAELTLEELRRMRTRLGGQPVPTLAEALECVNGRTGVMLELKVPAIAAHVAATVNDCKASERMMYASFIHSELLTVRREDPQVTTIALIDAIPVNPIGFATDAQATHVAVAMNSLAKVFADALHEAGFRVFTYTADDAYEVDHAIRCSVDGIISNYPDRL